METQILSDGLRLAGHLSEPTGPDSDAPGLVLCHGFPSGTLGAQGTGSSFPTLADRIAREGWLVLTFRFRGCGSSEGNFSLGGWLTDVHSAVDHLEATSAPRGIWLAGFGTGGALCATSGAERDDVRGVATLGSPADFVDWANHPRRLLQHARDIGVIRNARFPEDQETWTRELRDIRPVGAAAKLAPRPLLVIHGSDDESVPHFDARVLSDAHRSAELRIIVGAAHDLRHDPRAVAVLLGWLDRQRHGSA